MLIYRIWNTSFSLYRQVPLSEEWSAKAWRGFFSELQQRMGTGDWRYVATASGGFQSFWWSFLRDDQTEQYLQLEYNRLCFKLGAFNESIAKRVEFARTWNERIVKAAQHLGLKATKPGRYKAGKTMTVAILPDDYRVANTDGLLNMEGTLKRLADAKTILRQAANDMR